jgi:3-deoxy-manno-octulosonate cytidylyltransferase (CMP-KDO synthetase)
MEEYIIVIPARYKSTRFPGKPLVDLEGKSMIQRTYEQCKKAVDESLIWVATEDERIVEHCQFKNMNVILTSDNCLTGTDRVAEVSRRISSKYYINVQGDEPLFNPEDIKKIIASLKIYPNEIINGYCEIKNKEHYESVSVPKVVFRPDGRLLYMSRSPIPGNKQKMFIKSWRQICIYAFPKDALKAFTNISVKTCLEEQEDIEILRFLELGYDVRMVELSDLSVPVDNPEDVLIIQTILKQNAYKLQSNTLGF